MRCLVSIWILPLRRGGGDVKARQDGLCSVIMSWEALQHPTFTVSSGCPTITDAAAPRPPATKSMTRSVDTNPEEPCWWSGGITVDDVSFTLLSVDTDSEEGCCWSGGMITPADEKSFTVPSDPRHDN